ncbi:hypothetical protein EXIGLDRAFT_746087 [Exidia glandulosa HHB12029]|uniref:Uncharacterized protein n=1 Tax=Exidia glandulosa HHB12029 TaxID=1314781 RepID=A0A165MLP7_EXIGL|nr:hypothetical protein EXIGLDRAFT_746087 [Exidia glandulosa HHB12029]
MMFNLNFIFYAALAAAAACAAPTTDSDTTSSDTPVTTTSTSIAPSISVAPTSVAPSPAPSSTCPSGPGVPWNGVGHTSDPNDIRYGVTLCDQQLGGSDCYYLITIANWSKTCRDVPELPFTNKTTVVVPDKGIECQLYSDVNCNERLTMTAMTINAPTNVMQPIHGVICGQLPASFNA